MTARNRELKTERLSVTLTKTTMGIVEKVAREKDLSLADVLRVGLAHGVEVLFAEGGQDLRPADSIDSIKEQVVAILDAVNRIESNLSIESRDAVMSKPSHLQTLAEKVLNTANELIASGYKIPPDAIDYDWSEIHIRWHSECQELLSALRDVPDALGRVSVVVGDNVVTCKTCLEPNDLGRPAWERISFSKLA